MAKKQKSKNNDVLTSIARTVGTTAGIIVSAANRLTATSAQESKSSKPKRRLAKAKRGPKVKASIKRKPRTTKKARQATAKKRG